MRSHWVLLDGEKARRFQFDLNLYTGIKLKTALQSAGFRDVKLFGNLEASPYDANATSLVAVARV
jgi:hypothetical protein